MAGEDDLGQWDDDALVRALRAPGSAAELADQEQFVAAFRAQRASGSVGRVASRFGIGATTVVTAIALSGGVAAAAYTQSLPDPVQRFAHEVLGPVGVPAAPPEKPEARPPAPVTTAAPTATPAPAPTSAPTPTPSAEVVPTPTGAPVPDPTGAPTAVATPTLDVPPPPVPTPTPTATPVPVRVPTSLTANASSTRVTYGGTVVVSGVLTTADGSPARKRTVRLGGRTAGQPWTRFAVGRTDGQGRISLESPALTQATGLRLSTPKGLRSPVLRISVVPVLTASTREEAGSTTVALTAQGARPGDTVVAYRRQGDRLVRIGSATLDDQGAAVITLRTPKRPVRVLLRLPGTPRHPAAQTAVTIGRPAGR